MRTLALSALRQYCPACALCSVPLCLVLSWVMLTCVLAVAALLLKGALLCAAAAEAVVSVCPALPAL